MFGIWLLRLHAVNFLHAETSFLCRVFRVFRVLGATVIPNVGNVYHVYMPLLKGQVGSNRGCIKPSAKRLASCVFASLLPY